MLRLLGNPQRLCDGVTRRDLLRVGGLGAAGLTLADFLQTRTAQAESSERSPGFGRAKACILLYKYGAPSQHETFDPKPDAPEGIRGEFGDIATAVPGIRICEHLPRTAAIMDRLTVVRSLTHPYPLHGTVYATTGIPDVDTKIESQPRHKRQWPFIGSVVDYLADQQNPGVQPTLPRNIAMPFILGGRTEIPPLAGPYGAFLGSRYDPVFTDFTDPGTTETPDVRSKVFRDPYAGIEPTARLRLGSAGANDAPLDVRRLDLRRTLLEQFDTARRRVDQTARVETYNLQQQMAFSLLTSGKMAEAIDFGREPDAVRAEYGLTLFGQCALAARRLVEAGATFVTVFFDAFGLNAGSWDTHDNQYPRLKNFLLPVFDQTYAALIRDLEARGLLDETLVLCISEHGRTPKVAKIRGGGRDHWSRAYSQVFAGGGFGRGQVIGRTDAIGGDVESNPISPKDILATAFHQLGIDPHATVPDSLGRPMPITGTGELRTELLG